MSFASSLTQTATIQRKTGVKDTHGAVKEQWADVATNVPCRVSTRGLTPKYVSKEGEPQAVIFTPTVYMQYRTDVLKDDRLVIDGENYDVILPLNPAHKNHHLTISTVLIRG